MRHHWSNPRYQTYSNWNQPLHTTAWLNVWNNNVWALTALLITSKLSLFIMIPLTEFGTQMKQRIKIYVSGPNRCMINTGMIHKWWISTTYVQYLKQNDENISNIFHLTDSSKLKNYELSQMWTLYKECQQTVHTIATLTVIVNFMVAKWKMSNVVWRLKRNHLSYSKYDKCNSR